MVTEPQTPPLARELGGSEPGPVEPVDYGTLNAVYGVLLAGVVLGTRRRHEDDPIRGAELVPLGAATFALSKLIAREKIGSWLREPFVEEDGAGKRPRGRRLRRAVGELLTCTRCVGAWSALGVVGLRAASPDTGRMVTAVLATSAVNDWLQTGFNWACAQANAKQDR